MTMMMDPPAAPAPSPAFAPPAADNTPATMQPYALTPDAQKLVEEYRLALQFRQKHTSRTKTLEERYIGNWYRTDQAGNPTPENSLASYITFMLPELAFSTPTARVQAKRAVTHAAIAEFVQMGVQAVIGELDIDEEIEDATRDALTGWGVMHVGLEARHANSQLCADPNTPQALRPFAECLSRDKFLMEGTGAKPKKCKWHAHQYYRYLRHLQGNPRFDQDAVSHLTGVCQGGSNGGGKQEAALRGAEAPDRDQVLLVDFWLRETQEIVTMAMAGDGAGDSIQPVVLRKEKWWGPPEGPYVVFGIYRVSGDPYPISPLQQVMEQFEELQQHLTTQSDEAANYKTFVLVEAAATDVKNAIANAQNGQIIPVKGLAGAVQEISMGKVHPERIEHTMQLRERFDRTLGFGDAQRGKATGKTATGDQIVQSNTDTRTQYMRKKIRKGVADVLGRLMWYLFNDPLVVLPVTHTDPMTGQPQEGLFLGGPVSEPTYDYRGQLQQPQDDADWTDFNLEVDPTSMEYTDDQVLQQQWMGVIQTTMQIGQLMQTMPWVNWRLAYKRYGESMNVKDLDKLMFNPMAMQQFAQDPSLFGGGQPVQLPPGARPDFANAGLALPAPGAGMGAPGMGAVGGNFNPRGGPGPGSPAAGPARSASTSSTSSPRPSPARSGTQRPAGPAPRGQGPSRSPRAA